MPRPYSTGRPSARVPHGRGPIDVEPSAGRFVAFPAETIHEVLPIHGGDRYTLVAWLY
jgi:predicted 2-oxoglutarate/Fe(II)-dependent dioxygenase YbiX